MARSFGFLAVIAATTVAAPAHPQPISQSMAECAALYQVAGDQVTAPSSADRLYRLSDRWKGLAVSMAQAEGRGAPEAHVETAFAAKCAEWSGRGPAWAFSGEFRDWTGYCRALGKYHGIEATRD